MVERLRERDAHPGGAAERAVEARVRHHLQDGGDAASLLTDEVGEGGIEFHLAGGVAPVPELVLEPLQAEAVLRPVR